MTLSGEPIQTKISEKETRPMILEDAAIEALMTPFEGEAGEAKFKAFNLAQKIYGRGEVDIEPGDAELIKNKIGRCYAPVVVGPAYKLLNG